MKDELIKSLYRKEIVENTLEKLSRGFELHNDLCVAIKKELERKDLTEIERSKLAVDLDKVEWEGRVFATNYKSTQREYQLILKPRIIKLVVELKATKEYKDIQFVESDKKAKELAEIELFGKATVLPDNIELTSIIKSTKDYLKNLEKLINEQKKEVKSINGYQKAKLQKEIYENEIHAQTLTKRLRNREDYYINQFLPQYTIELAEAKEKCEDYFDRANEMMKENVDIQLQFIVKEYHNHKDDDDKLWLYYIALRNRVNSIIEDIKKNHQNVKRLKKLIRPL